MSSRQLRSLMRSCPSWVWLPPCVLICALWVFTSYTHAQAPEAATAEPAAQAELSAVRAGLEQAQFDDAQARAHGLLARTTLSARERNDTLELLAVAQVATRHEALAQASLAELFARDPEHPQRMRDPGPNVEAFFARVRAQQRASSAVELHVEAARDEHGRVLIDVGLGDKHDAVETLHVFARGAAPATDELAHVVADVGARERLVLALPAIAGTSSTLALYVEARAPSGFVLGHDGSATAPLRVHLEPTLQADAQIHPTPLARTWWLWTSVAIVIAGISVTGALVAH